MDCYLTHIRWSLTFVAVVTFISAFDHSAKAQEVQFTPTKYQLTMKKLELCHSSTCTDPYVLGDRTAVFDIGSAVGAAGAIAGTYITSITLNVGETYTHVRATLSRSFTLKGGGASGAFTGTDKCFTDATGSGTAGTATMFGASTDADASGNGNVATDMILVVPDVNGGGDYGNLTAIFANLGITIVDATTFLAYPVNAHDRYM